LSMEPPAKLAEEWFRAWSWVKSFLKEELEPHPGRYQLVARMVIATTLSMLITMTFQLPFGLQAVFALLISRDTFPETAKAVKFSILGLALGAGYVILGAMFILGDPLLRMLWVIGSLFIAFFVIRILSNYVAAVGFGILIAITIPILDERILAERKVELMLWVAGQTMLVSIITAVVALFFTGQKPRILLVRSIAERLDCVEDLLKSRATGNPVKEKTAKNITRLVMLGTSTLRRNIQRSGYSPHYAEQMGVVVPLVGGLVDLAGSLVSLDIQASDEDRNRMQILAQNIASIRADLLAGQIPRLRQFPAESHTPQAMPLLPQMEKIVSLIAEVFMGSESLSEIALPPPNAGDPPQRFFLCDALSNPEYIKFALKGCLAASLCYIIYTALDWPGISTAVLTCGLTALTAIGSSHQKQFLRFAGAIVGGLVIGMGSQMFILPSLDSITGFTVLFIVVTCISAWFATSGPRLSYFGVQVALAFYLITLQEFKIQTSLAVARDRVVGILLGISMMWLAFDQFWSAPTMVEMRRVFVSLFRLLAQFVRQPISGNHGVDIEKSYSLRETINGSFDQVRARADAVWLEFGPSRQKDLAVRSQILGWQMHLRVLFISCVALLKYRLRLPSFELPEPVHLAGNEFEESLARVLEGMADQLEGKVWEGTQSLEAAFERLRNAVLNSASTEAQGVISANSKTFLSLSERITSLAVSLGKEIES
jgi:multidrug resistance protein MdtO